MPEPVSFHDYAADPVPGLTSDQEERARRLHRDAVIVLSHDHLYRPEDLAAMRAGGVAAKVVKLTVDGIYWDEHGRRYPIEGLEGWARRGLAAMDAAYRAAESDPEHVMIIRTVEDLLEAKRTGRAGLILSFEGGKPLEESIELLRMYWRLGLREMQLAWAGPNQLCSDHLTPFGRQVVREMNRLGILIDLSHLSDTVFQEVMGVTEAAVTVSHTGAHEVSGCGDCLKADRIRMIAESGGVIGVHFVSSYIRPRRGTRRPLLEDLVDHVEHIAGQVGIEHVSLGPDWFLHVDDWVWVHGGERIQDFLNVTRALVKRGFSDDDTRGVLGENLMRVFGQVWRGAVDG